MGITFLSEGFYSTYKDDLTGKNKYLYIFTPDSTDPTKTATLILDNKPSDLPENWKPYIAEVSGPYNSKIAFYNIETDDIQWEWPISAIESRARILNQIDMEKFLNITKSHINTQKNKIRSEKNKGKGRTAKRRRKKPKPRKIRGRK
tara:strand:+ start:483 stop:923 length:441 start_codon:yes stop_codon:yes gene_type:complete